MKILDLTPALCAAAALSVSLGVQAQAAGARGGVHGSAAGDAPTGPDHFAVEHYIAVSGRAEVRIRPTALRVVLAITSEAETAAACQTANEAQQAALVDALAGLRIPRASIHLDFISMLPVYEWRVEEQASRDVAVEWRTGFRLQTNAHVEVDSERRARDAIRAAFRLGISDVLAVDYWSDALDAAKQQAQEKALREARRKSDLLLTLFEPRPRPINVREDTAVRYPVDLYRSFDSAYASQYQQRYGRRDSMPTIAAFRPKNTYYHGFFEPTDVAAPALPMRPEISVVATVKIYYAAPGRPRGSARADRDC